jgi:DNA repair exonuclease SbcCD ATPase subunit
LRPRSRRGHRSSTSARRGSPRLEVALEERERALARRAEELEGAERGLAEREEALAQRISEAAASADSESERLSELIAARSAELERREAAIKDREKDLATRERKLRRAAESAVAALLAEGTPEERPAASEAKPEVTFSEGIQALARRRQAAR